VLVGSVVTPVRYAFDVVAKVTFNYVAESALPLNVAVIVPAEKFPEASLWTIVEAVLASVYWIQDGAAEALPLFNK